jgi:hypothetical protein
MFWELLDELEEDVSCACAMPHRTRSAEAAAAVNRDENDMN